MPKQQDAVNWKYYTRCVITILLVILKLTNTLNISWWVVTAPIWVMPVISIAAMLITLGTILILAILIAIGFLKEEEEDNY